MVFSRDQKSVRKSSATEIIGLSSAAALLLALLYVYGYSVGSQINVFPYFQLTDFLRLAVEALTPTVAVAVLGAVVLEWSFGRVLKATDGANSPTNDNSPSVKQLLLISSIMFLPLLFIALAGIHTVAAAFGRSDLEMVFRLWLVAGPFAWILLVGPILRMHQLHSMLSRELLIAVFGFPAMAIVAFCGGGLNSQTGDRPFFDSQPVQLLLSDANGDVEGRIQFLLSDYVIFLNDVSGDIVVISKDSVIRIDHKKRPIDKEPG